MRRRLYLLAALISTALLSGACAQISGVPFRVELSPVHIERGYDSHRGDDHGHADDRYREARSSAHRGCACGSHERIRLIAGSQRGKGTRPSGWHTREWFERRGYNLDNYSHRHERSGAVHHGRHVRRR